MLIASDILLEGAAGILVPVFECPVDLSRSPGSVSEGSQEKINSSEGPEKVGEDPRNGQKRGLMDPVRGLVLEPSLGEKAPGVSDSLSCKHPSISHWGVEIGQGHSPPPPPPQNSESRLAKRSAAAKNKVQSTSAKTFPKMLPANCGDEKKSQENVGGAKNPSDIRTDDLPHSTQLYINKCNNNKALYCFFPS